MSKRVRILLAVIVLLPIAILLTLLALQSASQSVPTFYLETLKADPVKQDAASAQMLQQAAALTSALKQPGGWEARITAEQINGWLAVDMAKNHPNALPPAFRNPRVAIDAKHLTVACLLEMDNYWSVVSLTVEPYMTEPNVLALRFLKARAGLVPVPLQRILDRLTQAALDMQLHLEWRQAGNDPVALLSLPAAQPGSKLHGCVDALRLGNGEIYLAGTTSRTSPPKYVAEKEAKDARTAPRVEESQNQGTQTKEAPDHEAPVQEPPTPDAGLQNGPDLGQPVKDRASEDRDTRPSTQADGIDLPASEKDKEDDAKPADENPTEKEPTDKDATEPSAMEKNTIEKR